jgi:hypothetical protein
MATIPEPGRGLRIMAGVLGLAVKGVTPSRKSCGHTRLWFLLDPIDARGPPNPRDLWIQKATPVAVWES